MKEARYPHDCEACIYLGQINEFDAYYCPGDRLGTCYILRHGVDGDYASRTDYRDTEYNKIVREIGFSESFTPEWIETYRRKMTLIRILANVIAGSM